MPPKNRYEDEEAISFQGAEVERRRRERRKPKLKRTRRDLLVAPGATKQTTGTGFADPDMQELFERGYFDTLLGELKGGKEATVFLVGRGEERLAAKVYADIHARSFRDDRVYWDGFYVPDARTAKAMKQRTQAGLRAQQAIWVAREYHYLWLLHAAGVRVPRPAVGPEPFYYHQAGAVVLMELVGAGDVPAPRLSDVRLEPEAATAAFTQSLDLLRQLCQLGLVHGDLSTYNLLWHDGAVWLIDVPQMVVAAGARGARELLARDVRSLATSFRRHGVHADANDLLRSLRLA